MGDARLAVDGLIQFNPILLQAGGQWFDKKTASARSTTRPA